MAADQDAVLKKQISKLVIIATREGTMTRSALLIGWIFMSATFSSAATTTQPTTQATGASAAFTSDDPVIKQTLAMLETGKFKEAQSLLASDDGHADPNVAEAREEMKEIIQRTKREYSVSADALLAKVSKSIPDATLDDLKKWTDAGELQFRDVDGVTKYFNREPQNLFRFSK